jgi:cellulose synthase/poly-beta-1,6-N-acetylglucosamine synthase-like glycosyltransferase
MAKKSFLILLLTVLISTVLHAETIPSLKGRVIDMNTKRGMKEVPIVIQHKDSTVVFKANSTSDSKGYYVFKNIPAGKYTLTVDNQEFHYKKFDFEITPTHTPNMEFELSKNVTWMFDWGKVVRQVDAKGNVSYLHPTSHLAARIVLGIYGFCLILIFFYAVIQFSLARTYQKTKKKRAAEKPLEFDGHFAPKVTIQLPMFNEMYVAERIIEETAKIEYPREQFEIQVLDDSTDETKDIIAAKVAEIAATGINIKHIHRTDRTGYKAGALDAAMDKVEGEFIAIFDSDFMPSVDFLKKTIPYFEDPKIGVVQTRWGHLNKDYSLLTELQAFGLDGHFSVEQSGRTASGHFINFNGTAGIWRKETIYSAGGWEHDTLTEDLDLSYRAQMKGWVFKYLEDVVSPAELPITISALKNQQHRWMKGGAECFKKMWKRLLFAKNVRFSDKMHGMSHLFNSSLFISIMVMSLLSLVVLQIKDSFADLNYVIQFGSFFILSTVFLFYYYWVGYRGKTGTKTQNFFKYTWTFFKYLTVIMGLTLNNTIAILEGYLGIKSSFVRTPKFNVNTKSDFKGKKNKYDKKKINLQTILEGVLMVVFGFTAINRAIYGDLGMVPFHGMMAIGYGIIFVNSVKDLKK